MWVFEDIEKTSSNTLHILYLIMSVSNVGFGTCSQCTMQTGTQEAFI
jgi:hypothetical protein